MLTRLDNRIGYHSQGGTTPRGLYLLARQHPGETPGSWVLDGMLDSISRNRPANWCVRSVPFADLEGVIAGNQTGGFRAGCGWMEPPLHYEGLVLQADISRWATCCQPELVVDLQASGINDNDGIHIAVTPASPDIEKNRLAWCNLIKQKLEPELMSDPFIRMIENTQPTDMAGLADYVHKTCGCCALTIKVPYTACGDVLMTPKRYREVGRLLSQAILARW
jgi:hypothetical protein